MRFFPKKNEVFMIHQGGIEHYPPRLDVIIAQTDTELTISSLLSTQLPTIHLPLDKITSAKEEIFKTEEDDSVIARAIVGNFLFGETGAIVGAMTAQKNRTHWRTFYVIRYESDGKQGVFVFKHLQGRLKKWDKMLNAKLPQKPKKPIPKDITL